MLIIIGKTCSGKDTIINELVQKYHYNKIFTYTTRPKREGENSTYKFISNEEFRDKINDGFFMEYKTYESKNGVWQYGSRKRDLCNADDKSVVILTPAGYKDFLHELPKKMHKSIYIYVNNQTIKNRSIKRKDDKLEAERRLRHDNEAFKGTENIVNKIVYNNADDKFEVVMQVILNFLEG